ncbi:hypothetical protein [Cohnella nanjingensis]|uniref:Uncharacterized protein n=1 Tax=Cohnella nanjingensis TaxID=1387779 RepID=A0A7X0RWV2_9BACL|nr:hypothetical protein [Cohnella nanjingensis]MBB6675152.1 hypothetical protein [Cohnella nanjingensis]
MRIRRRRPAKGGEGETNHLSQPNIPNIAPVIGVTREEAVSLPLRPVVMDELAVSHLNNAEAE